MNPDFEVSPSREFSSMLMYFSARSCTSFRDVVCFFDIDWLKGPSRKPLMRPIMAASVGRLCMSRHVLLNLSM